MVQDARSLEEIKRDTERARAGLTQTVDELRSSVSDTASDLRERLSPDAIKSEVRDYFKTRGEALFDNVKDAARNNPVQAIAVGASLAYPLLRLVRAIPAPVLMVGAGIYLASSKTGKALTQQASDAAADFAVEAERRTRDARHQAADMATAAGHYASDTFDAVSASAAEGAAQVRHKVGAFKDKAAELKASASGADDLQRQAIHKTDEVVGRASNLAQDGAAFSDAVAGSVRGAASSVSDNANAMKDSAAAAAARLKETIADATDAGYEAAAAARRRAAEFGSKASQSLDQAGKTLSETVSNNPLLVAGIGLLVGGLIASAIPRLRLESETLGAASDELKNRARETVASGVESIKQRAQAAFDGVARSVDEAGLAPNDVSQAASDVGQRVRKVADAAISTFESPSQNKH